jgi:hypothetical protein
MDDWQRLSSSATMYYEHNAALGQVISPTNRAYMISHRHQIPADSWMRPAGRPPPFRRSAPRAILPDLAIQIQLRKLLRVAVPPGARLVLARLQHAPRHVVELRHASEYHSVGSALQRLPVPRFDGRSNDDTSPALKITEAATVRIDVAAYEPF